MKAVKLIPMLFSTDMARANMSGLKTMTRRTRGLEEMNAAPDSWVRGTIYTNKKGELMQTFFGPGMTEQGIGVKCPYGKPGDVMWMRETWAPLGNYPLCNYTFMYKADVSKPYSQWKPNLHMPLEACRFFAEIVEIRCERLHDITREEAVLEGVTSLPGYPDTNPWPYQDYRNSSWEGYFNARNSFASLWASINGEESWEANPYVWVVKYRRLDADELMWRLPAMLMNQKAEKQQRIRRAVMSYRLNYGKEAKV